MTRKSLGPCSCVLCLLIPLLLLTACADRSWQEKPVSSPILLVGVDGIEWELALPLIAEGRMPTFERLMSEGRYGCLETLIPTKSPVIWTTVATGMPKEAHGIYDFARPAQGKKELFNNSHRQSAALWNILSDAGRRVCVVGWWLTWPVEPVHGVMVAQTNTPDQLNTSRGMNTWKGTLRHGIAGQVHPARLEAPLLEILGEVEEDLPALTEEIFGRFPHPFSRLGYQLWTNTQWAFRADQTYARISHKLLEEEETFDLTMIYFGGSDVVGHRFYRYLRPELYSHPPAAEQIRNFQDVIARYYCWLDGEIGRLIDRFPAGATVILVSDHGMSPVNRDNPFTPDELPEDVNSAHHNEGEPGIFIAAGPFIQPLPDAVPPSTLRREEIPVVASVHDIAPTILAMLRLPLGRDMQGRVLDEMFGEGFEVDIQPRPVKTHSTEAFKRSRVELHRHDPGEAARIEQLQALGYISPEDE
jgi:hypothetical protein